MSILDCAWTQTNDWDMCDTWSSDCGLEWIFEDGGPIENKMKFCCYCGKPLKVVPATPEDEFAGLESDGRAEHK